MAYVRYVYVCMLCIYYQSYIMQSLVFLTYFKKVIKEKPLGGRLDPPLVQEGLKWERKQRGKTSDWSIFGGKAHMINQ